MVILVLIENTLYCKHSIMYLILTFYFLHKLSLETNNLHFRKDFRRLYSCLVKRDTIVPNPNINLIGLLK